MFTVQWNTTGFAYGNYELWAQACPILGEEDIDDNVLTYGFVLVSIPGDVNADFRVQYLDLGKLLSAYGSTPDKLKWDSNCDINEDGRIQYLDLGILLAHYGQHYP
jgi:hypothetical protein